MMNREGLIQAGPAWPKDCIMCGERFDADWPEINICPECADKHSPYTKEWLEQSLSMANKRVADLEAQLAERGKNAAVEWNPGDERWFRK